MYLRKVVSKKTGRIHLQIAHNYRDEAGKSKAKIIQSLGYLDVLEKQYPDPIAHFTEVARQMGAERTQSKQIQIKMHADAVVNRSASRKNYGYIALSKIYHELELDRFFNNSARHAGFEYNINNIAKLLTYARVIYPCSKRSTFELRERFFENFDFTLDNVYDSLSHFNRVARDVQRHMHEQIAKKYGRDTHLIYYDVTNYYFEADQEDALRKRGYSKEHRRDPIVQMGLEPLLI